uniref:retinitis pigmentosa 1-like 1 protein isoform X4 n=1 Tax=Ictidomys tridecemlineatus TaxID=43179 RepID=UPI001A9EFA97|nr:retinitis pigmentosa 1-like 1 protein isoform X4 [Ictidomys tridecemlineatus]
MGPCFVLLLAALACCLIPASCCVTCEPSVMEAVKSLEKDYLPGHLEAKDHEKVMDMVYNTLKDFQDRPFIEGSYAGIIDKNSLEEVSRTLLKELKRITDSNVKGDQFVKQLYQMLEKEKAKFAQYAAQFQKKDYCPNKCGLMLQRLLWCPECRIGNYHCWKSLDCGERLVKVHEKENLTLNCLFEWHLIAQELTDYKFERIWEDGSETLLYQGKNPMLTILSLTPDNSGSYRCELGSVSSGPSTIIHYLVTVLPPNATEESPTTSILFGSETESGTQGANVTGETSPAVPGGTGPASPTVQGETGPGVQGETAPLQGETGPTEQGEMGPNQEDTGSTEQGETAPLQNGMGSLAQGETAPQVQGETAPLQGEMTSPDLGETAPVEAETAPLEAETAPLQGETTQPAQGETTQSAQGETTQPAESETTQLAQGETTQLAQGETTEPFQVETAPLQGEMAPGEGEMASQFQGETNQVETAPLEEETAPPFQGETAPLQGEMAPGEGESASEVQGEAAPPNQDEMAPFEEETELGDFEMGQPLQNEMAPGQGEMTPSEQVETAPLQGEMTPPGQGETAQFQGEMATPVQGETSAAQGETTSPIQAGMAQLQNGAALVQDETAPFLGETAALVGDMAPLEETSVRPNPGELESSTTNQQPEQAKGVQQGQNLGLIIALPLLLILGLILCLLYWRKSKEKQSS